MTTGQQQAVRELERLCVVSAGKIELLAQPALNDTSLQARIALNLGKLELREGGLDLREREELTLSVPPGFPFDRPSLYVAHTRFAGFPHVTWTHWLCLYQSSLEWSPSDGLYGFFDRLNDWLGRAAMNDMDPIEGPLEPPHHVTDFSQLPFVIRANAPCKTGDEWMGLGLLQKHVNRIELVGWDDLSGPFPTGAIPAFAVVLPKALPMEFPTKGRDIFRLFQEQGFERARLIKTLALAALLTEAGKPIHLIVGLPMRRAPDGSQKLHIAVWTIKAEIASSLKKVFPEDTDTPEITTIRDEILNLLADIFEASSISWCHVLEDRSEIIVRRDLNTPMSWVAGKRVLILGCGALGSCAAEIVARASPRTLNLIDNAVVKPGILVRQNYRLDDIGANKAIALKARIESIGHGITVESIPREAHAFLLEDANRMSQYDLILDCTASSIFQMKLERDWPQFKGATPPIISFVIDGMAQHCLGVVVSEKAPRGVWDSYLCLKRELCLKGDCPDVTQAFYSSRATKTLFQPEPGCSDPTFTASAADVGMFTSSVLNIATDLLKNSQPAGFVISSPLVAPNHFTSVALPSFQETIAGDYSVRINRAVFQKARRWVERNTRLRSARHETGGLLWGYWDDALKVVWIFDCSGPPTDSSHRPSHFLCGIKGTAAAHRQRTTDSYGACGYIGNWHTHPALPSSQSRTDIQTMSTLVSSFGLNQKRAVMLIFGRKRRTPTAGIYLYESRLLSAKTDVLSVRISQIDLLSPVV